jgi:hypothetical protein
VPAPASGWDYTASKEAFYDKIPTRIRRGLAGAAIPAAAKAQPAAAPQERRCNLPGRQETGQNAAVFRRGELRQPAVHRRQGRALRRRIKAHTKHVLDEVQKELESAGSSMEKV